jgi:hypothetical protein
MKSLHKLVLSSSLAAIGLFGLQGSAMALTTMNANICAFQDDNVAGVAGIHRQGNSITNFGAENRNVVCPIVRTAAARANGWGVRVLGSKAAGSATLTCTLESNDFSNQFLGLTTLVIDSATVGNFDRFMLLSQLQVPRSSHQALTCVLPHGASLFAIQPNP